MWGELNTATRRNKIPQSLSRTVSHHDEFTDFHRLCSLPRNGPLDPLWKDVRGYLQNMPPEELREKLTATQKEGSQFTPLHVVCFLSPPLDVVKLMIDSCPDSIEINTEQGESPLGIASGGFVPAGAEVIEYLANTHPKAAEEVNLRHETPLLIYLKFVRKYKLDPCPVIVGLLSTTQSANTRDLKGHSPLYYLGTGATNAFSLMASWVRFFTAKDNEEPDFNNYKRCLSTILSCQPHQSSKTLFLRDLLQLPKNLRDVSFEKQNTREVINDIVGRGQYIALLMMDFYMQMAIVVTFTLGCSNGFENKTYTTVMLVGSGYWFLKRLASAVGK
jgi:hypothetical protein